MTLWQMEEVIELINNYRELECLWNYKTEDFKKSDLKKKAWQQLSKKCGRDTEEIQRKIKNLRTAYVVEKKKVAQCKKSSTSTEITYQPHLFYYENLKFLDPLIVLRRMSEDKSADNSELNGEQEESDDSSSQNEETSQKPKQKGTSSPPSPLKTSESLPMPKRKRKAVDDKDDKFDNAIETILNIAKGEEEDVYSAFTKSVALQIKQLPPLEAAQLVGEIQQLVSTKIVQSMGERSGNNNRYATRHKSSKNRRHASNQGTQTHGDCGDTRVDDEIAVHTRSWASELQKMSPDQRIFAKREIAEIICQAQLGSLIYKGSYTEKGCGKVPHL